MPHFGVRGCSVWPMVDTCTWENPNSDTLSQFVLENSSREDKHECPFARSSIQLTLILCEILHVGEPCECLASSPWAQVCMLRPLSTSIAAHPYRGVILWNLRVTSHFPHDRMRSHFSLWACHTGELDSSSCGVSQLLGFEQRRLPWFLGWRRNRSKYYSPWVAVGAETGAPALELGAWGWCHRLVAVVSINWHNRGLSSVIDLGVAD